MHTKTTRTPAENRSRARFGPSCAVRALTTLFLALLAACSGGGSAGGGQGGSGGGDGSLNQGSYSVADFGHVNDNPTGFHPLGSDGYQALAREELFWVHPDSQGYGRDFAMQDGPDASHAELGSVAALFAGTDQVYAAAFGQLDRDANSELVVATIRPLDSQITLHLVERNALGNDTRTEIRTIDADGLDLVDARVTLADIDGDHRDEMIVVTRTREAHVTAGNGRLWVFDDPQDGAAELLEFARDANHQNLWALPLDVDGDGEKELAIGLSGDTTDAGRYAVRLYDLDASGTSMVLLHGWTYLYSGTDQVSSRAVVGDFDSNGRDDLAWVGYQRTSSTTMSIKLFELVPGESWEQYASWSLVDISAAPQFLPGSWAVTAFHPRVGVTDLAVAYPDSSSYDYAELHHDRNLGSWSYHLGSIDRLENRQGIELAGSDVDSDGREEVLVGLVHYGSTATRQLGRMSFDESAGLQLDWQPPVSLFLGPVLSSTPPVPVLAAGDYDADGLALLHTGMRSQQLGDPIPLVVMSAPPTVDGISQNYDDTESAYSRGSTQGTTIGVSTYTSVTYEASVGVSLFNIFGAEGRASLEKGVERSYEQTRQETVVEGYRGSYDADVIVFQGTLYETYEYLITAAPDPAVIGTYMTLDIPVDANTYKWTVDYYNSQVDVDDRIGTDLLSHTPGSATSYPTRTELADLMAGETHWDLAASRPVGQGNASDFQSVSFANENATSEQRTTIKSYGGGAKFGISGDVDVYDAEGSTHGVFYGSETSFEASVGDISNPAEYESWRYNWGFSIHFVGRTADAGNNPTGYSSRKHNFQYLRYWVNPTGLAY
jgi:hypothetical protein